MGNFCSFCPQPLEQEKNAYAKLNNNERIVAFIEPSNLDDNVHERHQENLNSSTDKEVDVLIVGAGLSGLSAARYLHQHVPNLKVRIIEARDRAGGRTHSIPSTCCPEVNLDVGGQWIGPGQNRMLNLVEEFDLQLIEQKFSESVNTQDRLIECANYSFPPLSDEEYEQIEQFISLIEENGRVMDIHNPWTLQNAKELDSFTVAEYVQRHITTVAAQVEIFMFVQSLLACDPDTCSLLYLIFNIASGGGMESLSDGTSGAQKWRVKNGTQQISECLVNYLAKRQISCSFGTLVSNIRLNGSDTNDSKSGCVAMIEENFADTNSKVTSEIHAKHVVIACSPLLAVQKIKFDPPLPAGKKAFCEGIVTGKCVKILVAYTAPFWEAKAPVQSDVCINDIGFVHNIYLGSIGPYPALVGLITGSAASTFAALPEDERKKAVFTQFSLMYNCDYEQVSKPVEYVEKNWCADNFSAGCFSGILPPGLLTSYGDDIRSVTGGVIHWAGTETSTVYYGYMEGAILSGERTAVEIIDSIRS